MLLSALKYITQKVVKSMNVFILLILILQRFTEMGLLFILTAITWSNELGFRYGIPLWAGKGLLKWAFFPSLKAHKLGQMNSDFDMAYLYGLVNVK